MGNLNIEESWKKVLKEEFEKPYMKDLKAFLAKQYQQGKTVYPPKKQYFEAFNRTPFDKVKVVILGQDPYHGPGQAHGLCFSVFGEQRLPPSLKNIFKELKEDLGIDTQSGNLSAWADQGVLLLNSTLTVEHSKAGSHQKKGWEEFTDFVLKKLNERKEPIVFILWGSFAQKKGSFIDIHKHLVLKAPHPSPLSAHRGFFGTRPFSKTNAFLKKHGQEEVNWQNSL